MAFPSTTVDQQSLLETVARLRPVVEQAVGAGEVQMTLPEATVRALTDAGLFRIKLPQVLGGLEADLLTQYAVIEALSYVDASAGWCLMIGASSVAVLGAYLPDSALAEVFRAGRVPRAAAVFAPTGTATPMDGGYRVRGRWACASGVRHAEWVSLGCLLATEPAAPPQPLVVVLPTAGVTLHDNWDTLGLRGTGSCDVSVDDVVVPAAFTYNPRLGEPLRGGPLYRLGTPAFVAYEHAAFALGVARRALDVLLELAPAKRRGFPAPPLAERGSVQRALGELDLKIRSVRALVLECNAEAWQAVSSGQTPDAALQARVRAASVFATDVAVEVVTQARRYAGGEAVYKPHLLERAVRDLHTATQHVLVSDVAYEDHAKHLLGLADSAPEG
jgi:alkylation response protein AidB-like acyl-CoA dehydrogenase